MIKLFSKNDPCKVKVKWNAGYLMHLAQMLQRLREEKMLVITWGKGFWLPTETCFTDFDGKPIRRELRKLCSEIKRNPEKYKSLKNDIEDIIKKVKKHP